VVDREKAYPPWTRSKTGQIVWPLLVFSTKRRDLWELDAVAGPEGWAKGMDGAERKLTISTRRTDCKCVRTTRVWNTAGLNLHQAERPWRAGEQECR